jgi:hypothetical protein
MKYKYETLTQKLGEFRLPRFKSGQNNTKEGMMLSLEKDLINPSNKTLYFILRNEATKVAVYEAYLLPRTKLEHFMDRPENWRLFVMRGKVKDGKLVPERDLVKLQFENPEQASQFATLVSEFNP